jgi:hypothetical protein
MTLDQRLLGEWKSDKRRTLREFLQIKGVTERGIKPLRDKIFGRLVHQWGRRTYRSYMDGDLVSTNRYSVLAKDDKSVALWIEADPDSWLEEKDRIAHIHFEGANLYWFSVFMGNFKREWFRRVATDPPRRGRK